MLAGPFTQKGTLFGKGSLPVVEQKMHYLEQRHKIIAHNLANVQTRFYKSKDLPDEDFHRLLTKSIEARDHRHVKVFDMIHNSEVYPDWDGSPGFEIQENKEGILRHKDNNVDIDKQMALMSRNQMMFKTMSRLAKKNYDLLRSTIRETP